MENTLKITGSLYNKHIAYCIEEGSSIDELLDAFKVVAIGLGYLSSQFDQAIIELAQEIEENEKENIS